MSRKSSRPRRRRGLAPAAVLCIVSSAAAFAQTALPDLGTGLYQSYSGGLYSGGSNQAPVGHQLAVNAQAQNVVARDSNGVPDPQGLIGMTCLGMSNASQEFEDLQRSLEVRADRNAALVIVDTCEGGTGAVAMAPPDAPYWTKANQRLALAGVSPAQVQVAWLKQALQAPASTQFPQHAILLRDTLRTLLQSARTHYPNLRIVYVSSRVYAGYGSGEPFAYESGFAVKWLIEDQINGDAGLNFQSANGPVLAPALLWGPYIWANGTNPNSDGLTWVTADFESDHIHPSDLGEAKVGAKLSAFFDTEASARTWIDSTPGGCLRSVDAVADAVVFSAAPNQNDGAGPSLDVLGGAPSQRAYLRFAVPGLAGPLLRAQLLVRNLDQAGPKLYSVADTGWDEATLTYANAPPLGALLSGISSWTRENAPNFDVTTSIQPALGGASGFAIEAATSTLQRYASREGLVAPRLLLRYVCTDALYADGFDGP